ncbi:hypothetical protein DZ858_10510 [Marixanthomonas ophiurae]|uniref:Uncharacterized protein n=1 Tax=Marixanthomonas ophiurae TaxID=387659 RepID=A0A3E1Q6C4_9FLAO|nr:hypothetical protein DZ858_10510 [Marixanthomonas ophiurae]
MNWIFFKILKIIEFMEIFAFDILQQAQHNALLLSSEHSGTEGIWNLRCLSEFGRPAGITN